MSDESYEQLQEAAERQALEAIRTNLEASKDAASPIGAMQYAQAADNAAVVLLRLKEWRIPQRTLTYSGYSVVAEPPSHVSSD